MAALIARRLTKIEPALMTTLVIEAARWLEHNAKRLFEIDGAAVWALFDRLVVTIAADPERSLHESDSGGTERD